MRTLDIIKDYTKITRSVPTKGTIKTYNNVTYIVTPYGMTSISYQGARIGWACDDGPYGEIEALGSAKAEAMMIAVIDGNKNLLNDMLNNQTSKSVSVPNSDIPEDIFCNDQTKEKEEA